jgi:iron complex outermembrane receptor protein
MIKGCTPAIGRHLLAVLAVGLLSASTAAAQSTEDLRRMSLSDLLNIRVTTPSRMPEPAGTVPAAIFVITQEDIRRSGATSIPEALRLAPGVQVARISAGTWSIGIRGFSDRLSRSMLVLIDGRAVYSPLFAGTYWETQDTELADIDRIEVIRGPGGTLWGANAVDGIINIITKAAKDTQGLMVTAVAGSEDRAAGTVRYGGQVGDGAYRAYAKGFDRGPEFHPDGQDYDHWRAGQGGFRSDLTFADSRALTIQGDAYGGRLGEHVTTPLYTSPYSLTSNVNAPLSGGNVLARFSAPAGSKSDIQIQTYFDRTSREEVPVAETRNTFDLDFQQTWRRWARQTAIWGAGYRVSGDHITAQAPTAFEPPSRTDSLYSAFAQDEFMVVPDRWRVIVGAKFEHNDYTGFEMQPSVRALWTPAPSRTIFAAITRAVRTPSRVETDYTTTSLVSPGPLPTFVRLIPNPAFDSEKLIAYEVGYRGQPASRVSVTVSTFYNHLTDTLATELLTPFVENDGVSPPRLILPVDFANGLHGSSYGGELTADARPAPWWRLTANYSYLNVQMTRNPGGKDVSQERRYEGLIPHHTTQLGSSFDVSKAWSIDWLFRYVSALPAGPVPGYNASTLRLGWAVTPKLELSIVGQDLFASHHLEWPAPADGPLEIQRSIYARVVWRQ